MSTASNLAVSVVAGVAVMFIWQQIQKAQAKTLANDQNGIDHGGVQGGKTMFGGLFAPEWAREAVNNMGLGVIDYIQDVGGKPPRRIMA